VAGRVTAVHAKSGDGAQGQLLAEIDPTDFHIQGQADAAEIARLEALVAQAERFAERQQQLVAKGFISQNGADDARAQRDAARAQLANARARAAPPATTWAAARSPRPPRASSKPRSSPPAIT
jgi:multidrug resistance efflux pump